MAVIQVTQATRSEVISANRDLLVTVNLSGAGFSVYAFIVEQGIDIKATQANPIKSFPIFKNEHVEVLSMGTGTIEITTVNA